MEAGSERGIAVFNTAVPSVHRSTVRQSHCVVDTLGCEFSRRSSGGASSHP